MRLGVGVFKHTAKSIEKMRVIAIQKGFGKWRKGRKLSDDTKRKISSKNKGKKRPDLVLQNKSFRNRELMHNRYLGKKLSKLHCFNISQAKKGKKIICSSKEIMRRKENWRKNKNPKWSGGVSSEYHIAVTSCEWFIIREKIMKRDNYTCQKCNVRGKNLQIHHIIPWRKIHNHSVDNLITVCIRCHKELEKETRG